ncbi:MAG TPA: NUDIX domain-containing protein [Stellaceae bacterium]|nr:NUDIX domain-containing protein [Stellaceae bacterium]
MKARETSCGTIVTDGERLLLGHATRSPRWDIPKGVAEPGESLVAAARRELFEETGLTAPEIELRPLGVLPYQPGKDLALFAWRVVPLPDPMGLVCASCFSWNGRMLPEFDRFALFTLPEALGHVGKGLAARLAGISLAALTKASE